MMFIKQTVVKVNVATSRPDGDTIRWRSSWGRSPNVWGNLKLRLVETRKDAAEVKKLKMENYKLLSAA